MNPNDFPWTEDQQVTVTNPTGESYKFKVHSKEYELAAGRSAKMPGYIAWIYVYGMASKLCQADDEFPRWNEEGFRQTYYEKVYSGFDPIVEEIAVEEKPLVETLEDPAEDTRDLPTNTPPSAEEIANDLAADEDTEEPGITDRAKIAPMKPKSKTRV